MDFNNTIRNCPKDVSTPRFKFRCPTIWENLSATADPSVRHCKECKHEVYFCASDAETIAHAKAGHCIARPAPDLSGLPQRQMYIGMPENPEPEPVLTPEQQELQDRTILEGGVTLSIASVKYANRDCPKCNFPAAAWWTECRVCGEKLKRAITS